MPKDSIRLGIGTIYRKKKKETGKHYGSYLLRYTVKATDSKKVKGVNKSQDKRKTVSLNTKNKEVAIKKAKELFPIITAPTPTIVAEHVLAKWKRSHQRLPLDEIWDYYSKHPDRAKPKTQKIINCYKSHLNEFLKWLAEHHSKIEFMDEIRDIDEYGNKLDVSVVSEYADHLRGTKISVDTHCKKITRPAHIFRTLSKYLVAPSPWDNKKLMRLKTEESHITEHRKPFPPDKEKEIFKALKAKSPLKILNKAEIEVLCYILKYTGQRLKDCVYLSWNNIDMAGRRLSVTQEKTGKKVTIPIASELYEMLIKAAEWKANDRVLPKCAERYAIKGKDGTVTGGDLINKQLLNVITHVGLTPSVKVDDRKKKITVYGVHSFRHGFASACAANGIPRAVCASILGADTSIIDNFYVHIGADLQKDAVEKVFNESKETSNQDKIESALAVIKKLKDKSDAIIEIEKALKGEASEAENKDEPKNRK